MRIFSNARNVMRCGASPFHLDGRNEAEGTAPKPVQVNAVANDTASNSRHNNSRDLGESAVGAAWEHALLNGIAVNVGTSPIRRDSRRDGTNLYSEEGAV